MLDPLTQIRKLTTALMISGILNIILIIIFFYWTVKETIPTPYFELKPANKQEQQLPLAMDHSNSDVIRYLRILPMERLIARLKQTQLIENGYTLRDLTLACLVDIYHFDLERALKGFAQPDQKRMIIYGKRRNGQNAEITVYPGLSDKQFEAIINFATLERWPLTSHGLFLALRKQKNSNPSLNDAFFMTPEYLAVEMLFSRAETPIDKKQLLQMLMEGDWSLLSTYFEQQKILQDLSDARRQRFLLDYIQHKSKSAALLMLKTDSALAIRKLDDGQVIEILKLLDTKSPEAEKFAISLLTSPRSDAVWKAAAERLYAFAGEPMPEKYHHHAALSRFVSNSSVMIVQDDSSLTSTQAPLALSRKLFASPSIEISSQIKQDTKLSAKANTSSSEKLSNSTPKLSVHNILPPAMRSQGQTAQATRRERFYVVQEGDSLWKIAKRFNVDIDQIKTNNRLDSDFLKPGRPLVIPENKVP